MFTNPPPLVISTLVVPGISVHSQVLCAMKILHVKPAHSVARPVYNYSKAQLDKITEDLDGYYDVFCKEAEYKDTDQLRTCLKNKILELRHHFIPVGVLNEKQSRSKPLFFKNVAQSYTQKVDFIIIFSKCHQGITGRC